MKRDPEKAVAPAPEQSTAKPGDEAAEKLSKPPKDKREIIIAPSKEVGPDVTLE
jgi:hypothetical protein